MMWERRWDTVALVGWGPGRIVVVFRGTTTLKNVFADLQAGPHHINTTICSQSADTVWHSCSNGHTTWVSLRHHSSPVLARLTS